MVTRDERRRLVARLRAMGVEADEQWSIRRLRQAVREVDAIDFRPSHDRRRRIVGDLFAQHATQLVKVDGGKEKTRIEAILDVLAERAIVGRDVAAAREYLDRTVGKATQPILVEGRVEEAVRRVRKVFAAIELMASTDSGGDDGDADGTALEHAGADRG